LRSSGNWEEREIRQQRTFAKLLTFLFSDEEDWEKDLAAEEFEVVDDGNDDVDDAELDLK